MAVYHTMKLINSSPFPGEPSSLSGEISSMINDSVRESSTEKINRSPGIEKKLLKRDLWNFFLCFYTSFIPIFWSKQFPTDKKKSFPNISFSQTLPLELKVLLFYIFT